MQITRVANLTTGFSVKHCLIQNHHDFSVFTHRFYRLTRHIQTHHRGRVFQCVVAAKFCSTINTDSIAIVEIKLAGRASSGALFVHAFLITRHIETVAFLTGDVVG